MKVYYIKDECYPVYMILGGEKPALQWRDGEVEIPADLKARLIKAKNEFWGAQAEFDDYVREEKVFKKGGK